MSTTSNRPFIPVITFTLLGSVLFLGAAEFPQPPSSGYYVLDLAEIIDASYEARINELCREVERKTSAEMALLTISSFEGEEPWYYATELGNYWGVGQEEEDNGLVMVVAIADREVFTAAGSGMEAILPDATLDKIYRNTLVPNFRKERYGKGVYEAFQLYAVEIERYYEVEFEGTEGAPRVRRGFFSKLSPLTWAIIIIALLLNLLGIVAKIGRKRGAKGWFWTTFGTSRSSGGGFSGGSFGGGSFSGGGAGGGW